MKYLLILAILLSFNAVADQRFETWQGLCHFAYDVNDDDNEVYFANCTNTIDTFDAQDGQGRLAYGSSITTKKYNVQSNTLKLAGFKAKLKGADTDPEKYDDDYTSTPDTPCIMVTSNYDAGNDDNNETVYVTNDWDLVIKPKFKDGEFSFKKMKYDLNGDGVVNLSDFSIYRASIRNIKITYELSCRGGVAQ